MSLHYINEPLPDMFAFETSQLLKQLEELILSNEKSSHYSQSAVDEIFRIMHTVKRSSAMMMFENISSLPHSIEDIFCFIRRDKPDNIDCPALSDLTLEAIDSIENEVEKVKKSGVPDGDAAVLMPYPRYRGLDSAVSKGN